ncbi:MAG: hypothetical protein NVSMB14_07840 [Isosphaeraceae bacterium]
MTPAATIVTSLGARVALVCSLDAILTVTPSANADEPIDFGKQAPPILKRSCLRCHNAKKHKSGLRLNDRADALKAAERATMKMMMRKTKLMITFDAKREDRSK